MDDVIRSVKDIDTEDRHALEHVLGQKLSDNQQIVIHVQTINSHTPQPAAPADGGKPSASPPTLPEWCNVYEGLSDAEVAEIEKSIVRLSGSRSHS